MINSISSSEFQAWRTEIDDLINPTQNHHISYSLELRRWNDGFQATITFNDRTEIYGYSDSSLPSSLKRLIKKLKDAGYPKKPS